MTREEAKNLLYDKHGEDDKLIDQIYNNHEAQLKTKDEEIKELGEIVQQYLIPSKNYDAIIKAKDEEIEMLQRRLYHAYGYIKDRYEPKEQ